MYNLIKLQKHDAFYQSREGGKCSIKCFNADLQCHTTKAVEKISHSCPLTDSLTDSRTRRFHKRAMQLAKNFHLLLES